MKRETSLIVSIWHLMSHAEPVSPTRKVRRRPVANLCMTNNDTLSTTQVRPYFYVTDYLGSYVIGSSELKAEPKNYLFQHEYGHYLQSQKFGPSYMLVFGFPSFISAAIGSFYNKHNHRKFYTERYANKLAYNYFMEQLPDGTLKWNSEYNPL